MDFDHVLIIGFGGPTKPEEIRPFLNQVARGRNIPEARLREVEHHYELIGGRSPYNDHVFRFQTRLEGELKASGIEIPVFAGMRNWHPFLAESMETIKANGLKKGVGIILSPFRSTVSCYRYKVNVDEAREAASAVNIEYQYTPAIFDHSSFIEAQTDVVRNALEEFDPSARSNIPIVFTAHSIPLAMLEACSGCRYSDEFKTAASQIAGRLSHANWQLAYQSRSGNPRDPWLEPDVISVARELKAKDVLAVPIGFLCDNAEILFDLDIELREETNKLGISYHRTPTILQDQKVIHLFVQLIAKCLKKIPVS